MDSSTSPILSLADLEAFDPVTVEAGRERRFCCPFPACSDKPVDRAHRSLVVNVETGAYLCHRCGAKGRLRDYWTRRQALTRGERSRLATRRAFALSPQKQAPMSRPGIDAFKLELTHMRTGPGVRYLERRGIRRDLAAASGVRYSTDWYGRPAVLFPIVGQPSRVIAWQGRHIDDGEPRMHDDGPKGAGVFVTAGALAAEVVAIVEAPIDALSLAACSIPAVALCGTNWPDWLPVALAFHTVALAFDADAAGDDAGHRLGPVLASLGARVDRWRPIDAKDWNEALVRGRGLPCWRCAMDGVPLYEPTNQHRGDGVWSCEVHMPYERPPSGGARPSSSRRAEVVDQEPAGRSSATAHPGATNDDEPVLRGRALIALDRRRYPRVSLPDGRSVGRGLFEWAPVLREVNGEQLAVLIGVIEGSGT